MTGGTSGIGKETVLGLAKAGFCVVMAVRNLKKGEETIAEISKQTNNTDLHLLECDLGSFASIVKMTKAFQEKYGRIDVLINNAGIWEMTRKLTEDGLERNFAINHLAPFLITNRLLDLIKKNPEARIISLASSAHRFGKIYFDDLEGEKKYGGFRSYGQSKLANILFIKKLDQILQGSGVTANALHPGVVATNLFDKMGSFLKGLFNMMMISAAKGARTSIYLATSEEVKGVSGKYFYKCKIKTPSSAARDMAVADALWITSLGYVNKWL
ncbi:MAG: SDR family oxidoreductase [Bacteroidota bacterium]